jgi:hypothetical protein
VASARSRVETTTGANGWRAGEARAGNDDRRAEQGINER